MTIKSKIDSLDHKGRGIAHINGKVVFIPNALPGEEVEIQITTDKKKYSEGKVINYLKTSDARIVPKCPYYDKCGGCDISHFNYSDGITFKTDKLKNIISKTAKIDVSPEIISCDNEFNYRNKITLKIVNSKWGYYEEKTHNLIEIDKCLIAKNAINKILENKNLFKIQNGEIVIRCNYNDELIIIVSSQDKLIIDIDNLIINNKIVGIIINNQIYYGEDSFIEIINGHFFKVSYNSFFQVNLNILTKVFDIIKSNPSKCVIDLYCGVGVLGIAALKEKLYGIEIAEPSIKDALINAKMNKQTGNYYILGDSNKINEINDKADLLIIDPPRSGIDSRTMENIIDLKIPKIIYMSCDANTLARDLNILKENYLIENVYLLDMFPQTHHVECIVILQNKNS